MTDLETVLHRIAEERKNLAQINTGIANLEQMRNDTLFEIRQLLARQTELEYRQRRDNPEPIAS